MCRTAGRRCNAKWDDAHRERYNARRRIVRNSEKEQAAREGGDEAQAEMYRDLVLTARDAADHYTTQIESHETESLMNEMGRPEGMPDGTTTTRHGDFVLDDAPLKLARDRKAIRAVLAQGGMSASEAEIHANDAERWAAKLYHPRIALVRDADERVIGSLVYEDGAGRDGVSIHNMRVDAAHRGAGAGAAMIEHAKDVARTGGKQPRELAVYNMLSSAKSFYARNGADVSEHSGMARFDLTATSAAAGSSSSTASTSAETSTETSRCPDCGQFAASGHACPRTLEGSVVRGQDGSPTVVYHGSSVAFDDYDPAFTGTGNDTWGSGFYFTESEAAASGYGEHSKSAVLNIANPIRVNGSSVAHLDDVMRFSAAQSATILRSHPDIYRQPNDEEAMNPLGDYAAEFWDKDEFSRAEMDRMIDTVARENYDDVSWSNLEAAFPGAASHHFRSAVREVTGHDGVATTFDDGSAHWVAWFPDQIHSAGTAAAAEAAAPCAVSPQRSLPLLRPVRG